MIEYSGVILISFDGSILLQQRDDKPGLVNRNMIAIFGGTTEGNESPSNCAIREMYEELELKLSPADIKKFGEYASQNKTGQPVVSHIFTAQNITLAELKLHEGKNIFILKPGQDFQALNFTPICRRVLTDYYKKMR